MRAKAPAIRAVSADPSARKAPLPPTRLRRGHRWPDVSPIRRTMGGAWTSGELDGGASSTGAGAEAMEAAEQVARATVPSGTPPPRANRRPRRVRRRLASAGLGRGGRNNLIAGGVLGSRAPCMPDSPGPNALVGGQMWYACYLLDPSRHKHVSLLTTHVCTTMDSLDLIANLQWWRLGRDSDPSTRICSPEIVLTLSSNRLKVSLCCCGGLAGIRTRVHGFAVRCVASPPPGPPGGGSPQRLLGQVSHRNGNAFCTLPHPPRRRGPGVRRHRQRGVADSPEGSR